MPKIPAQPNVEVCPFPKHKGISWSEVVKVDQPYMEWLISFEGPPMTDELYDYILETLEEAAADENF